MVVDNNLKFVYINTIYKLFMRISIFAKLIFFVALLFISNLSIKNSFLKKQIIKANKAKPFI